MIIKQFLFHGPEGSADFDIGAPAENRNGWRAQVKIGDRTIRGPQRATKKEAEADLALARQSTSRDAYARCLQEMRAAVKKEKPVKEEPVDGSPDDPAPQASAASSSVPTHASVPAEVVETRSAGTGHAAADVSMSEDECHSAAEDNDLPEEDAEMTHSAAEDDDPPVAAPIDAEKLAEDVEMTHNGQATERWVVREVVREHP